MSREPVEARRPAAGGSTVRVRPARPADLARAGDIAVLAYRADGYLDDAEDDYADQLRDTAARAEHAELLVAVDLAPTDHPAADGRDSADGIGERAGIGGRGEVEPLVGNGNRDRADHAADTVPGPAGAEDSGGLVAGIEGAVLGSVTVVEPGTPFAEIARPGELEFRMLAVDPSARGRGVGAQLLAAVLDRARERGRTRVVLSSLAAMHTAHRLYERHGFVRLPERDWRPAEHVLLIAYRLDL